MSYGGRGSTRVALKNAAERGRLDARDLGKTLLDNPESVWREDLRRRWRDAFNLERKRMSRGDVPLYELLSTDLQFRPMTTGQIIKGMRK